MMNANLNSKFLEEYKKNFFPIVEIDDSSFLEKEKRLDKKSFRKPEFLIFSVIYNLIYFLFQIIFFKTENDTSKVFNLTIGLFVAYITFCLVCLLLKLKRCIKLDSNAFTFFSYSYICVDIFIVSLLSYFSKEISTNNSLAINVYDFNLILSGCLIILSCEFKFMLRHRIIAGSFLLSIVGLIIFRAFITKNFIMLIYSISITIFLILISFYIKTKTNILRKKFDGNFTDTQNVFDHLNSITNGLNVGIFIFRKDELFFANENGRDIIDTIPMRPFNQIAIDGNQIMNEIRPNSDLVDIKVSISDSKININQPQVGLNLPYANLKDHSNLCQTKEAKLLFENVILFEDFSKFTEKINKYNSNKVFTDSERKLENKIPLKNILENKEKRLNLYSFFSYLTQADKNFLSDIKDYLKLGIFELQLTKGKKAYFKIIAKMNSLSYAKGLRVIEFIFEDVTLHYNLLNKIEEDDLSFKKNVHEFKTHILSMLDCAEELKSQLSLIENKFSKNEKILINDSLDHMTNLSSFIGYQIKGLISKKEINSPANRTEDHKQINLNSLLNFCLNIMKTLLGCDSQKSKNIQAELNNDLNDYNVSFISDEIHVKQILLNFISNSVKFTNHGRIALKAKLKKINQNDALQIIIKDTGCGVKKDDNSKLFNEYAKFDNTQNNQFGTGLGLNISKSMAENLNLKIKFKSEENKGTKVSLCILNPIINDSEKFIKSNKVWRMNDISISKEGFPLLSDAIKLKAETSILEEREINISNKTANFNDKEITALNLSRLLSESTQKVENLKTSIKSNHAGLYKEENSFIPVVNELNNSQSSDTFDIDENNMKSTILLGLDHCYDISHAPNRLPADKITRTDSKRSEIKLEPKNKHSYFLNCHSNNKPSPKLKDEENLLNNCAEFNSKEIETFNVDKSSLNSSILRASHTKSSFYSEKILVVDDQLHVRRALVNLITKYCKDYDMKFEVIEECDGIECLRTIINNPFAIKHVFMDENMVYMNGTEAAQIIRKLSNMGKIPKINIISTTAEDNMESYRGLFDQIVTKPVGTRNLEEIFKPNL